MKYFPLLLVLKPDKRIEKARNVRSTTWWCIRIWSLVVKFVCPMTTSWYCCAHVLIPINNRACSEYAIDAVFVWLWDEATEYQECGVRHFRSGGAEATRNDVRAWNIHRLPIGRSTSCGLRVPLRSPSALRVVFIFFLVFYNADTVFY